MREYLIHPLRPRDFPLASPVKNLLDLWKSLAKSLGIILQIHILMICNLRSRQQRQVVHHPPLFRCLH